MTSPLAASTSSLNEISRKTASRSGNTSERQQIMLSTAPVPRCDTGVPKITVLLSPYSHKSTAIAAANTLYGVVRRALLKTRTAWPSPGPTSKSCCPPQCGSSSGPRQSVGIAHLSGALTTRSRQYARSVGSILAARWAIAKSPACIGNGRRLDGRPKTRQVYKCVSSRWKTSSAQSSTTA